MKKIILFAALAFVFQLVNAQPNDCSNGRYLDSIFAVSVSSNVLYGHNVNFDGSQRDLKLDVYQPAGDIETKRPLILFAPKGSFLQESKTEQTMVKLCTHFASLGYVAASIDYRVGLNYMAVMQNASKEFTLAVLRAAHDYKAAIRYFWKDARTTNIYKIDTNTIIAGGSSAGAITALHVAYLNKPEEIPTGFDTTGLGGQEGHSGNPGYPSKIKYVVNLCGAIVDTTMIETKDIPLISMHGNLDTEVPYGTAVVTVIIPIMEVDGSSSISKRAQHLNIENPFHTFWGKTHIPYDENAGGSYQLYMDTVLNFVTENLHSWICNTTQINKSGNIIYNCQISPNPTHDKIRVSIPNNIELTNVEIIDLSGRIVSGSIINTNDATVNVSQLENGIYFIRIINNKKVFVQKFEKL